MNDWLINYLHAHDNSSYLFYVRVWLLVFMTRSLQEYFTFCEGEDILDNILYKVVKT